MSSQIASLFAELGFRVSDKGLKEFESKLNKATKRTVAQGEASTKAGAATDKATNNNRKTQNQLAKEIRANYAKVRTDRKQAVADIKRINDELAKGNLKGNQKRELVEARGRTQQRLDDLVKQEKAARDRIHSEALRDNNKLRQRMERRDEQAHKARTEKSREQQKRAERLAAQQARLDRQNAREKARLQSIQESRDYESWRKRGELARQERERESRHHKLRMREANQYNRSRNRGMSYRGAREYGRAWIPGIGGAFAAMQSTQSYQGYVGTQAGLTAATGSQEQAGKEFDYLEALSRRLGVFIGDMAQSFTSLSANTRNTSLEGQGTRDIFEAVTSYSRVLNLSAADQDGVFRALTQMVGKGQVYAEELRQQMGERLPGSFQAMARAAGYGSDEAGVTAFYKAVEDGEIRATEVFPRFAEELMKMANEGGALEKAMNSTAASIGRFRTNVYLANKTFNESGYDKSVRDFFNTSSDAIDRAEPFWMALGKAAEYVGLALEAPIELFGVLASKIPVITGFVKENSTAFKLLSAYLVAVVKPLRKLVMLTMILPMGLAAISDLIGNWNRDRTWGEWVVQIGLAVAAIAMLVGGLARLLRIGRSINKLFGGKSSTASTTTTGSSPSTSRSGGGGGFGKFLKGTAVATGIGGMLDANSDYRERFRDEPPASALDMLGGWLSQKHNSPLLSSGGGAHAGELPFGPQRYGSAEDLQAYSQSPFWMMSKQGQREQEATKQFIGDVHISVESSDPLLAGTKTEEAFISIFNREIRTASTSNQVTEK